SSLVALCIDDPYADLRICLYWCGRASLAVLRFVRVAQPRAQGQGALSTCWSFSLLGRLDHLLCPSPPRIGCGVALLGQEGRGICPDASAIARLARIVRLLNTMDGAGQTRAYSSQAVIFALRRFAPQPSWLREVPLADFAQSTRLGAFRRIASKFFAFQNSRLMAWA